MFIGHYAAGFVGKSVDRRIPLWHLFVASQLVDFVSAVLMLAGVEKVRIVEGFTEANPLDLYYYPYSHSLTAVATLAVAATLAYRLLSRWRGWLRACQYGGGVDDPCRFWVRFEGETEVFCWAARLSGKGVGIRTRNETR